MQIVVNRIKEPSTWAGLSGVAGALALLLANPKDMNGWVSLVTGLGAIVVPEGSRA